MKARVIDRTTGSGTRIDLRTRKTNLCCEALNSYWGLLVKRAIPPAGLRIVLPIVTHEKRQ